MLSGPQRSDCAECYYRHCDEYRYGKVRSDQIPVHCTVPPFAFLHMTPERLPWFPFFAAANHFPGSPDRIEFIPDVYEDVAD